MKKALALLIIAIIACQGIIVLTPKVEAQPPEGAPEVVCVPFHGEHLGVPHDAWIGKEVVLKGTAHDPDGDSTLDSYRWDFGDGYSTVWISGIDPYVIEARHTYTGTMKDGTTYGPGKFFTAWLYVNDIDGNMGMDSYFIAIKDVSDPVKMLEFEVNVAIDDGLWWLHKQAYRYSSGGIDYARWSSYSSYYTSATAESVLAFEIQGHQPIGSLDENPYVETVQRGLNYVFSQTRVVDISAWGPGTSSPYGDPDTNGNDIGIGVTNNREPYELGMVMMAIAASGDPDLTANTGPTGVVGVTYRDILTDMVDICAWGQNDYGGARGGWRYAWNYGSSDNSVSQWPMMALEAADTNWGIPSAGFVKTELDTYWLTYSQNADGSFGYSGPGTSNIARTGTGIIGLNYVGLLADNPRVMSAVDWLGSHWAEFGNYYGMYAVMKGMRTADPEITMVGTHDWYAEYTRYLVDNQQADGGWSSYYGRVLASDWAILILTPTVTKPGPVADAGPGVENHPPEPVQVKFDASGSYHADPAMELVLYEWDFESDGTWDYSGTDLIVEHAYPAYYVLAELVKTVIGADYLLGGKGWDLNEVRFVEPEEIKEGYNYWNPNEEKIDFGSGLDCSGLAFWSYNKMVNTANYEDRLLSEGAQGQWETCDKIDKEDLRLGDLLFFDEYPIGDGVMNHVAMYLGAFKYEGDKYNVVHASGFTNTITPANYDPENEMLTTMKTTGEEQILDVDGYGRVTEAPAPDSIIDWDKTVKDYAVTLRVTDNSDPQKQDTDTCIIHITAPPWKPIADPNGPYEGYEHAPVHLDGSGSYDPESEMYDSDHPWYETIATYEWDLDNDGLFDDSTDVNPSMTWETKGTYSVGLRVTDSQPSGPGGTIGPLDVDTTYTTVVVRARSTRAILVAPVRRDSESEYKHNIHEMRLILLNNGWTDDTIIFLTRSDMAKQETDEPWIDGDATYENVEAALDALASGGTYQFTQTDGSLGPAQTFSPSTALDTVFIELRDHGAQRAEGKRPDGSSDPNPNDEADGNDGVFCTYKWDDRSFNSRNYWYDDEFDAKLDSISYHDMIFLIDACHSGEFIPDCEDSNRLILTSSSESEVSGRYAYKFYERIRDPNADGFGGGAVDGRISCEEAHYYAVSLISGQSPQISDNIPGEVYLDTVDANSPAAPNDGPADVSPFSGLVLVNEFFYDPSDMQNTGQWVEIYNPTDTEFNISGWVLEFQLIDGVNVFPDGTHIGPAEYIIVAHDSEAFQSSFTVPLGTVVLDDDEMGNNLGAPEIDILGLFDENLKIVDVVHYGGGPGRAPATEPPNSVSRYKGSLDTDNSEIDWYVETDPTPGCTSECSGPLSPVIPEVPLGTIMVSAAMIIALVAYVTTPKWRRKRRISNN